MRLCLFLTAVSICTAAQSSQPTAVEFVGSENTVTHVNLVAGTAKLSQIPTIPRPTFRPPKEAPSTTEATQDAVSDAITLPGNKAIVLVKAEQSANTPGDTVELQRYALPSWKLEAKRALPDEKVETESYLVPSLDGKAFFVVSFSDIVPGVSQRRGFQAAGAMQPLTDETAKPLDFIGDTELPQFLAGANREQLLPYVFQSDDGDKGKKVDTLGSPLMRVPGATLYEFRKSADHPSMLALLRSGGRLTMLNPAGPAYLANTGDAILVHANKRLKPGAPRLQTDEIAVYSADTGKETAHMSVPMLATQNAKCIALWHDQLAVFFLPQSFVVVNFTTKTVKTIPHALRLDPAVTSHALWVESEPNGSPSKPAK